MPKSASTLVPAYARPSPTATTPMLCRMLLRRFTIIAVAEISATTLKSSPCSLRHLHVDFTNARWFHNQIDRDDPVEPKLKNENDPWFSTWSPDGSGNTVDERKLCTSRTSLERLGHSVVAFDLTSQAWRSAVLIGCCRLNGRVVGSEQNIWIEQPEKGLEITFP